MNDILLDEIFDLNFITGDFNKSNSFSQDVELIIALCKGQLKNDPVLGVNLIQNQNSTITANELIQKIRLNLQRDGKKVNKITVGNNQIQIQ